MPGKKLSVLARGTAKVPVHSAHHRGDTLKFMGREVDLSLGDGVRTAFGHRSLREPTVVEQFTAEGELNIDFNETIRHLRDGDLWPADEPTAAIARCLFDPKFGDEYPAPAKAPETSGNKEGK